MDRYKQQEVIGKGSYAVVRIGEDTFTNQKVAIKTYDKFRLLDPEKRLNVKREIDILQKLEHKNIIKLNELIENNKTVNLIMEYIGSTSLKNYIKQQGSKRMDEEQSQLIFQQITCAVGYCHENNIVHRDIKLENILIDTKLMQIKLIDFGFATKVQHDQKLNVFCGTPAYMAPEIVNKQEYDGKPADVWSLGILLYVLLYGKFPFNGRDDNDLFRFIRKGDYKLYNTISKEARSLIQQLLNQEIDSRLNCKQILEHQWLKKRNNRIINFQCF